MGRIGVQPSLQRCRVGIDPCPRVDVGVVLPDGLQQLQGVLLDTVLHDPLTLRTPSATRASVRPPERLPLPVPLARACLVGAHSLLTRQPNSSGPSWSPGGTFST